jgi:hypothetical protein
VPDDDVWIDLVKASHEKVEEGPLIGHHLEAHLRREDKGRGRYRGREVRGR